MQRLARDVQRQVFRVDQPAQESKVLGQQLAAIALHQDSLGAQVDPVLEPGEAITLQVGGRAIKDGPELDGRVNRQVQVPERSLLGMVRQVLIEPRVLLFGDLVPGLDPDGLLIVDHLARAEANRVGDEAGIAPDDVLDAAGRGEILGVFLEVQDDLGAAGQGAVGRRDREAAGSLRLPLPARLFAIAPRSNLDPVGDHERRVEPDAELADERQVGLGSRLAGKGLEELARPAVRDRPQVRHQLIVRHAHAIVPDDQPPLRLIGLDHNLERSRLALGFVRERDITHLVERVGRVRDQLADRDLPALVERVREEMQKLLDLCLEGELLPWSLGCGCHHRAPERKSSRAGIVRLIGESRDSLIIATCVPAGSQVANALFSSI